MEPDPSSAPPTLAYTTDVINGAFLDIAQDYGLGSLAVETGAISDQFGNPRLPPQPSKKRARLELPEMGPPPMPVIVASTATAATATTPTITQRGGTRRDKGLRQFANRVGQKLQARGTATYNEVADDLVADIQADEVSAPVEEKNVRRRVYDALNVLLAIGVVEKSKGKKKQISWIGLPPEIEVTPIPDFEIFGHRRVDLQRRVEAKRRVLVDQLCTFVATSNLLARNSKAMEGRTRWVNGGGRSASPELGGGVFLVGGSAPSTPTKSGAPATPAGGSVGVGGGGLADGGVSAFDGMLELPFVLMLCPAQAVVDCQMDDDLTMIDFSSTRPIHFFEHGDVLKKLELDRVGRHEVSKILPQDLLHYFPEYLLFEDAGRYARPVHTNPSQVQQWRTS